jgi:serine/threonine protein kinase
VTSQKWQAAWQIYRAATDIPEHERQRFLDSASADPEVLEHVLVLLEQSQDISTPASVPEPIPAIGSIVGRYEVLSHIGSGGMGTVYSARDRDLDRTVALKFVSSGVIASVRLSA